MSDGTDRLCQTLYFRAAVAGDYVGGAVLLLIRRMALGFCTPDVSNERRQEPPERKP